MPLPCPGHLGHGQHCCGGHRCLCHELGTQAPPGLLGLWALWSLLGLGATAVGTAAAGRIECGPWCFRCPAPCGRGCLCYWEGRVVCTTSPATTRFSGAQTAATARELRFQAPPSLFPWFCLLFMFQSTHFQIYKREDRSSILLRWIEHPLLNHKSSVLPVVDRKREMKRAHYNTVMLIITILLIDHFFPKVYFYFPGEIIDNFCSGLAEPCSRF